MYNIFVVAYFFPSFSHFGTFEPSFCSEAGVLDLKDDNDEDNINGSKIQNGQLPKKTESSSFKSKTPASEQKEGSKVPKWLKLGKK